MALTASGDYLIDVTTGEKGLPNSSVTAITQTADGYLWVGTYNGLARFDGERFVRFDPVNTPELRHARIRRLYTLADGTLWICAHDGSVTSYREGKFTREWNGEGAADSALSLITTRTSRPIFMQRNGEFIRMLSGPPGTNRWEVLRSPGASAGQFAVEDSAGIIWSAGRDRKIYRLRGSAFEVVPNNGGLVGTDVNMLTVDSRGRVWAATEREFAVWDGTKFDIMTPTNGEPVLDVSFLRVLANGDVWTIANGRVRKSHEREWIYEVDAARDLFTGWRDRTGLHEDAKHGVWLSDYGRGLFHIRADGRVRQLTTEDNFPGERVDSFHEDREGNIWVGVDRGGLVRIREKRFSVLVPGDSAAAQTTVSVAEDAEGAIWIGTYGGGLHRWWHDEWQAFSLPGKNRRGFVFSVYPDQDGKLWTSAGDEDLHYGAAGNFTAFTPEVHGVKVLLRASDGRLWVGRKSGLGVVTRGQFRQFYPDDGVARTEVRALAEAADGTIWVGAGDGTLTCVTTNGVKNFRAPDALGGQPIWSLLTESNGVVWAGTFRGLLRFQSGQFTRYTTKEGFPDDIICQILDDGEGRLWFGSKQGIFNADKQELHALAAGQLQTINCTAYGRYDGLPSLECSDSYQPAAWRTHDGQLLFTTLKGVVAVRPGEVSANLLPPPVLIESAVLDGVEEKLERNPEKNISNTSDAPLRLVVGPRKQQVRIQFTGLSFVSPDRVRFKYKLEGLDREWSEPGIARFAQYNVLPPGDYRFVVKACNNDGVWNEAGAALALLVQPYFFETWWFKISATAAGVGLVIFAVRRVYVRRYRRKLEQVERQRAIERDRARIAKDIHDDLGAGLTHIALLSELARRDTPQELPNHVGQISEMARELTRSMDEIVWAIDPHNDTLDSLVTYVTKFAQEYLSVAGIRCRLDVPAELPTYVLPAEVRHNLFLTIKEALNNVVKHARATEAWLRIAVRPTSFSVILEDNGCGLADGQEMVREEKTPRPDRILSGQGLKNMKRRLAAIGGQCIFVSDKGKGTRVELSIELSRLSSPELVTGDGKPAGR